MSKICNRNLLKCLELSLIAYSAYKKYKKCYGRKKRSVWVREIYANREAEGFYETTFKIMKDRDEEMFIRATRMTPEKFDVLLHLLENRLQKFSIRKPISPECRLALTVMYLAHGGSRNIYAWKFKMGVSTVGRIILETCSAIWEELSGIYLAPPNEHEWQKISDEYLTKWGLPNCVGAIDGKHINIVCPPNGGSMYYNYKGRHSIVLLAACDANYTFTAVDIGAYGSQSDGGILKESTFGALLLKGDLPLPKPRPLPNTTETFPCFFVGDNAFPLRPNLMRPFPGQNLTPEQENFNKRLSRARITIENTFGILAARWRVIRSDIHCHPENVDKIIKAVVVLHNYLKVEEVTYCPTPYADHLIDEEISPGIWRSENIQLESIPVCRSNNASRESFSFRNTMAEYLYNQI